MLNLIHGCYYYKVTRSTAPAGPEILRVQDQKKYIILHNGNSVWHLSNISVDNDTIRGYVNHFTGHNSYKTTIPGRANKYKKGGEADQPVVLNEVHIYLKDSIGVKKNNISAPLIKIDRIELYDPDKGTTAASWIFGGLGIAALTFVGVLIIVALTKESCPFIYVDDGNTSKFIGEIYSGAIYPSVERHDYLPVPEPSRDQTEYTIKMTNEVHEIQNTNLIELNVIDHPSGTKVLIDKYGNCQTMSDLQSPVEAVSLKGTDILKTIGSKDSLAYFGEDITKDPAINDGIIMKFRKPANSTIAKLVVNAKSTFWLDYTFTKFHELFGKEYDCWVDKQKTISSKKMKTWILDQNIPLSVFVEKNGKWRFVDYYNVVGPMAAKEDVLQFDVSDINTDYLRVKLQFGFMFWEVDYAGIDYSPGIPVKQRIAELQSAIDNKENDVKDLIKASDLFYYTQPEIGDMVTMKFKIPERVDNRQTLILHSQGYYKILLNQTGEEKVRELLPFRKKGHFPHFSNEIFKKEWGQGVSSSN